MSIFLRGKQRPSGKTVEVNVSTLGGGLPDWWTVDEESDAVTFNGTITISPSTDDDYPLSLEPAGGDTDAADVMQVLNSDGHQTFYLDSSGDCYVSLFDNSASFKVQSGDENHRMFSAMWDGVAGKIGFFDANPVVQPQIVAATPEAIIAALADLGLVIDST